MNIKELSKCKNLNQLNKFVNSIPTQNEYQRNFKLWYKKSVSKNSLVIPDFNKLYIKVWNFVLQQENPVYLGKTSDTCKVNLGKFHGMECSGH